MTVTLDPVQGLKVKDLLDQMDAAAIRCEAQAQGFRLGIETAKRIFLESIAKEQTDGEFPG